MQSDDFDLSPFSTLTTLIADEAQDVERWKTVLQHITDLSRTTPPRTEKHSALLYGTPFTRVPTSFQDASQTRTDLQQPILVGLNGCTFEKACTNQSEEIHKFLKDRDAGELLRNFPEIHSEHQIWDWWDAFQ